MKGNETSLLRHLFRLMVGHVAEARYHVGMEFIKPWQALRSAINRDAILETKRTERIRSRVVASTALPSIEQRRRSAASSEAKASGPPTVAVWLPRHS